MVCATSKPETTARTAIIHFMIYSMHMKSSSAIDISMSSGHMFSLAQAAKDGSGGGGGMSLHIPDRLTELIRHSAQ